MNLSRKIIFMLGFVSALWRPGIEAATIESASPMQIFIFAGQSNCEGKGDGAKLPAEYAAYDPSLHLFHRFKGLAGWRPLAPYSARPDQARMYGCGDTMFGPEISFGYEMKKLYPNQPIGVIKVAVGGTSVISWSKDSDSPEATRLLNILKTPPTTGKNSLYLQLVNDVKEALAAIEGPYEVAGFVWVQAEKDSLKPEAAAAWAERVVQLHKDLAAEIGYSDKIPLLVMEPHFHVAEKAATPHAATIMAAMQTVAEEGGPVTVSRLKSAAELEGLSDTEFGKLLDLLRCFGSAGLEQIEGVGIMARGLRTQAERMPNLRLVPSSDLSTHEGLHFDTEGQLELGRRISRALTEASSGQ